MPRKSCESHSEGFMWNATHFSSGRQQLLHSMMCTFQPSYRGRYYFTCMLTQANPFPECFYYLIQLVQVYPDNAANAAHLALLLHLKLNKKLRQSWRMGRQPWVDPFVTSQRAAFLLVCALYLQELNQQSRNVKSDIELRQLGSSVGSVVPSECRKNADLKEAGKWPTPTRGREHLTLCDITGCLCPVWSKFFFSL